VVNKTLAGSAGLKFLIIGGNAERNCAREIIAATDPGRVFSFAGETGVGELVELVRSCRTLLTNDNGPMHVAAGLKIPVVALFGPTRPEKTGPYGETHIVMQPNLECVGCLRKKCPGREMKCHLLIAFDAVSENIMKIIGAGQ
jgi:ADP-heptose:LPS heptosyltransferase